MDVVELTTTGRRTGRPHTVLLTAPLRVGGRPVLVASRGGDDRPPDWLLNLQADPVVGVRAGRGRRRVRARVATPAERAEWWPRITATHPAYRGYQERAAREIALVVLEPDAPGRPGAG
jgi:deazaflavin-dependent oxidoreductase (nitroreductase family)